MTNFINMNVITIFMLICGLLSFVSFYKHLLSSLLSLEFMVLSVFWNLSVNLSSVGMEIYFSLFFLIFAACEGALGLSLLVAVVRSYGNDRMTSLSFLSC